ncbi:hypothetical protein ASF27_12780 [Methylobacterium sp. Leaf102]|uniref:hypothetical protein n=1 Tax=Methylobacterium sp. Leaf102 TaxID=1736253 RepID=UPI0006F1F957|nr:hypothetical protein [Methylobacterium sp. Leaf102]KQP24017.1 hypothetical protein ASF27_12780 [Methylobacterium sp. Leaf102]
MAIDAKIFQDQFEVFKERVLRKSKVPFTSFREGFASAWEGYKLPLRKRALERLGASSWPQGSIGNGQILKKLISAIEIAEEGGAASNNLVRWPNEYGHRNRSHFALLDALDDQTACRRIEQWAFDFFRGEPDYGDAFEELRALVGSRYDLLAYLFFLREPERFMPIGSQTFDRAFGTLEIGVRTAWRCSWENYADYTGALQEIRAALTEIAGLSDVRLVDAHSFCWLLVRPELERPDVLLVNSAKGKASNATIYGGEDIAIRNMIDSIANTVKHANGQKVEVTKKLKELGLSRDELAAHLRELMNLQQGKCALTGITIDLRKEGFDRALRASPDRKNSDGHYELGNIQIVCAFVNGWKGAMPDEEFRRLLELVRRPSDAN